jgi:hypothetical protein
MRLKPACPEGQVPIPTVRDTRYFHKGNPLLEPYVAPGPAHALPAEFVNQHLLRPFDRVYGKNAAGTARVVPMPQSSPPQPACDGVAYYDSCYYYGDAAEYLSSDGGGMTFDIEAPLNFEGEDGGHSIDEIAVEAGGTSLTDVEMGWSVSFDQWGDTDTHLFIYHWINGAETCYDACNWQQYSGTYYPGVSLASLVGQPVYMGWVHANGAWWAWFNDEWLGYFNDSEWSGTFTQAGLIQWYGEIASSNGVPPRSQMGNGLFAEKDASASMSTMCAANAAKWVCSYDDQQSTSATVPTYYDVVNHSSYGAARYGGPGQAGTVAPEVAVTPASTNVKSTQSLDVTVAVSYETGNPNPSGKIKLTSGSYISAETTLSSGSAQIRIPAGALEAGGDKLTADYTPDSRSAPTFSSASGTASVTVVSSGITPQVKITTSAASITTLQPLTVKVAVAAASGKSTPAGTVKLTSGTYSSKITALSSGDAVVVVPARSLTAGTDKLTVTYAPDPASYATYNGSTGSSTVLVKKVLQSISVTLPSNPVKYGVAPITLEAKASSGLPVTFSVLSGPAKISAGKLAITGAGTVDLAAKQAGNAIYGPAEAPITVMVVKAKLTVTTNSLSMKKGSAVPRLTYKMTGFVNGDTQSKATTGQPKLATTATSSSMLGKYPITVTAGKLAARNYVFAYKNGTLTVTN